MARLLLASPVAGTGKTMIAAGLARKLSGAQISELPAGELTLAGEPDARVIVVATPATSPADLKAFIGDAAHAHVILNRVAAKRVKPVRESYEAAGISVLGVVTEDELIASPTIGRVAEVLSADGEFIDENRDKSLDHVVIASIAADPGQTYFNITQANAIIVRSDKPDLQLAALNAGASCLIVTGGLPVLSYVLERVDSDEIPLLRTKLDTKEAVAAIEALFGAGPFSGSPEKLQRLDALLADVKLEPLLSPTA
jgi:BioD-like phosphotransacetylase family protein